MLPTILRIFNILCWFAYLLICNRDHNFKFRSTLITLFIIFQGLSVSWNFAMKIFDRSPIIYILFWSIVIIFELFYVLYIITFRKLNINSYYLIILSILAVISMPVIISAFLTLHLENFGILNTTDVYYLIILMLGCIYILYHNLKQEDFIENIEIFFIFSGFVLFFSLNILLQNVLMFDYSRFWSFRQFSTILSQIYWLGSVFIIWKIRSKHLS